MKTKSSTYSLTTVRRRVKQAAQPKKTAGGSDTNTVELGPWLDTFANKEKIYDYRLFYVLKPNMEDVVKFGIAGTKGDHGG